MRIYEILAESNAVVRTAKGSLLKRSPIYGVGKVTQDGIYMHRDYAENLIPEYSEFESILKEKLPEYNYNIVKYAKDGNSMSFLMSPDFDTANEPLITEYVNVKKDGNFKRGTSRTIYHHKWQFVKDDYPGFDVEQSIQRSKDWLKIPEIPFKEIGKSREYWLNFLKQNSEHLPKDFVYEGINESKYYTGGAIEKGGTSTNFPVSPAILWLHKTGLIKEGHTVLDYGAGKYARNANYLREIGIKTYAYDPYNGSSDDGWSGVTKTLPNTNFDVGFSCFVLNVVPVHVEREIISKMAARSKREIHIVRNTDIISTVKTALMKKQKFVWKFFQEVFLPTTGREYDENTEITDELILEFCKFGVQTSEEGFQRICYLEDYGFQLIRGSDKSKYKVYTK